MRVHLALEAEPGESQRDWVHLYSHESQDALAILLLCLLLLSILLPRPLPLLSICTVMQITVALPVSLNDSMTW